MRLSLVHLADNMLTMFTCVRRFLDEKRSVQYLKEQNSLLIGDDGTSGVEDKDAMEL